MRIHVNKRNQTHAKTVCTTSAIAYKFHEMSEIIHFGKRKRRRAKKRTTNCAPILVYCMSFWSCIRARLECCVCARFNLTFSHIGVALGTSSKYKCIQWQHLTYTMISGRHMHFLVNNYTAKYTMRKKAALNAHHSFSTNSVLNRKTESIEFRTRKHRNRNLSIFFIKFLSGFDVGKKLFSFLHWILIISEKWSQFLNIMNF